MRIRPTPGETLVTIPQLADVSERRAVWRQTIATLGQSGSADKPPPLDSVDRHVLETTCQFALDSGLADDLDWIAPGPAGVALYEIMTALPQGSVRREFGRRVFARLYGGAAGAFASVATRMVWGSVKQLQSATMRARVSLCFSMPIGSEVNTGPLALALVSRREHLDAWVGDGSAGALHSRRLAAMVLEQAAREAMQRASNGDIFAVKLLTGATVRPILDKLLADREPLVWRHAAVARGILAGGEPHLREEIDLLLDPSLSPTEWRRAVVSLVACLSHDPEHAMAQCRSVLSSELVTQHPGLVATFAWGLPRVIETEPELAEELLAELAAVKRPDAEEAISKLLREVTDGEYRDDSSIYGGIRLALTAYETEGAAAAQKLAEAALQRAEDVMAQIERQPQGPDSLRNNLPLLIDLDVSALERSRLYDLLLLGRKPGTTDATAPRLEQLYDRLGDWLLQSEQPRPDEELLGESELTLRRHKLVAFLHLLDVQTTHGGHQNESIAERVRTRIKRSIETLMDAVVDGPDPALHRVTCAALSRSFDAAVREQIGDVCDLLLVVVDRLRDLHDVQALLDASTDADMRSALAGYVHFLKALSAGEQTRATSDELAMDQATAYLGLSQAVGGHGSYRAEALRRALLQIGKALETLASARGLTDLVLDEPGARTAVEELEHHLQSIVQLTQGARIRFHKDPSSESRLSRPPELERLSEVIDHSVRSGKRTEKAAYDRAIRLLVEGLAGPFADSVSFVLARLHQLPINPPSNRSVIPLKAAQLALPNWLLPRRTIGAFYVVRPIGAGGVSSVFLVKRIEERRDPKAHTYALKVPHFDPATARSLSEQEFLEMFRDEAGALLALPQHTNLARFVNFDVAAKPKPILVMEMIPGDSLEKIIRSRSLTLATALAYLDGILEGLAAMHEAGVAHLDIKPSNVILRDENTPVLVDFGLSGRQLRPGCGTPEYCAPEVLGLVPEGLTPEAIPADMYAFACTAIQVLTGQLLFDADNETALISKHISHDGWPKALAEFSEGPGLKTLAVVLAACLRRDPRLRPSARAVRGELARCTREDSLPELEWPLAIHGHRLEVSAHAISAGPAAPLIA